MRKIFLPESRWYSMLKRLWYFVMLAWYTGLGSARNKLNVYAGSCTYYFLISLVPIIFIIGYLATLLFDGEKITEMFNNFELYHRIMELAGSMNATSSFKVVGAFGFLYGMMAASSLMRSLNRAFSSIFYAKSRRKKILSVISAYIIIPLFLITAILTAYLSSIFLKISGWLFADVLHLVSITTLSKISAPFLSALLIITAVYISFMLLAPKRPRTIPALLGSAIFGAYFLILQKIIMGFMGSLLVKYALYGAFGTLLLVLLWVYLTFYGLLVVAQFTQVFNNYMETNAEYYMYVLLKNNPHYVEKFLMKVIPFSQELYARKIAAGNFLEINETEAVAIIVIDGRLEVAFDDSTIELGAEEKKLFKSTGHNFHIHAIENSTYLIAAEDEIMKLFINYPDIWDDLELSDLTFHKK